MVREIVRLSPLVDAVSSCELSFRNAELSPPDSIAVISEMALPIFSVSQIDVVFVPAQQFVVHT